MSGSGVLGLATLLADEANADSELASGPDRMTYAQASHAIKGIAARLASSGLEDGDCVSVEIPSSLHGALLVLALTDSGISYLPLPPAGVEARENRNFSRLPTFCRASICVREQVLDANQIDDWMSIEVDAAGPGERGKGHAPKHAVPTTYRRTSGSLGTPKLVAMPYAHEFANARSVVRTLGFQREDRFALPVPIFHTFGAEMLLGAVSVGMSVDLQPRSNVLKLLEREAEWSPTVAAFAPLHCEWLARTRRRPRPYRLTITGGDRIARSTAERYEALHGPLLIGYGSTETGGVAYSRIADSSDLRLSSVIYPRPGIAVKLEDSAEVVERGEGQQAGVLWIRNPHAFLGYVDMDGNALPHASLPGGGWYRTGDVAVLRDEGLQVLGRWDLSINRDGLLLPLADVESQARQIPEISEAVAVAGADTPRGRELVLFCTVPARKGAASADIRRACAERLPHYAVPDAVRIIEEMPRLPAGKPDRRALASLLTTSSQ